MRKEFEMSEEDLAKIIEASKPVPLMYMNGKPMFDQRDNANQAWERLCERMGFKYMTVCPVPEKGDRFFTADPL